MALAALAGFAAEAFVSKGWYWLWALAVLLLAEWWRRRRKKAKQLDERVAKVSEPPEG